VIEGAGDREGADGRRHQRRLLASGLVTLSYGSTPAAQAGATISGVDGRTAEQGPANGRPHDMHRGREAIVRDEATVIEDRAAKGGLASLDR